MLVLLQRDTDQAGWIKPSGSLSEFTIIETFLGKWIKLEVEKHMRNSSQHSVTVQEVWALALRLAEQMWASGRAHLNEFSLQELQKICESLGMQSAAAELFISFLPVSLDESRQTYSWTYKPMLDYLVARSWCDSFHLDQKREVYAPSEWLINKSEMGWEDLPALHFFAEMMKDLARGCYKRFRLLKQLLLQVLFKSKHIRFAEVRAASNAFTLLNQAGQSFSGMNLSLIKVQNSLLIGGCFESTSFFDADLTGCVFRGATLTNCDLQMAKLCGADFGAGFLPAQISLPSVSCFAQSADGQKMVFGCRNNDIIVWDVSRKKVMQHRKAQPTSARFVQMSQDSNLIVSASEEGTVSVFDVSKGAFVGQQTLQPEPMLSMLITRDAQYVFIGTVKGAIDIWDSAKGVVVNSLLAHTKGVTALLFTDDQRQLISASEDCTVKLWECSSWKISLDIIELGTSFYSLSACPENNKLAMGGDNGHIIVWDLARPSDLSHATRCLGH